MALSGGHSASVKPDKEDVLSGRRRVKDIPPASLEPRESPGRSRARRGGPLRLLLGLWLRATAALPSPARVLELPLVPGGRRRRARRRAAQVEEVVTGATARGWPREDVPGLFSAASWLVTRLAAGGAVAAMLSPSGPVAMLAAGAAAYASKLIGGQLGYKFGRILDRMEVAHMEQYMADVRDAAQAGMSAEACIEYAMMCDAGPFSPEEDICRWRPLWAGQGVRRRRRHWQRRGDEPRGILQDTDDAAPTSEADDASNQK